MSDISLFQLNLLHAQNRVDSKPAEARFVQKNIRSAVSRLRQIREEHPDMTEEDMKKYLFDEIDSYAKTVFGISYVFSEYMEYISNYYLKSHPNVYKKLSEEIKKDPNKWHNLSYEDCCTFDEYLSLYIFNLKKDLFNIVFDGYFEGTPENFVNFDELLSANIGPVSRFFFDNLYSLPEFSDILSSDKLDRSKKMAKAKEFSTWYKLPSDRKSFLDFSQLFIDGSYSYLNNDTGNLENLLRKDLANSTESIIENLEKQGELKSFLTSQVSQLISVGFSEFALPLCEGPKANLEYLNSLKNLPAWKINKSLEDVVSVEKLKKLLCANFLVSAKSMPLESLLALNSFWSNRYIKTLDTYSETMFAVHNFDLISKVFNDETIDISLEDVSNMLIKMNTFYKPACIFLEKRQSEIDKNAKNEPEVDISSDDIESKIVRFSYDPFISLMESRDSLEYKQTFDQLLPHCKNDIGEDADWYIRLFNPIYSSYSMKDFNINSLIASIENSSNNFVNAGIILDKAPSGYLPPIIGIGIDAGLSAPVRIHIKKNVLIDFLNSLNGNAIVPIYAGADDFRDSETGNLLPVHIVTPLSDKHKSVLKKASKSLEGYENPNLVAHLGFLNSKYPPLHLCNPDSIRNNKKKGSLSVKYIDLTTGDIYIKSDETYKRITDDSLSRGGCENHEF